MKLTADVKISIRTFLIKTLFKMMVGYEHCVRRVERGRSLERFFRERVPYLMVTLVEAMNPC